MQDESPEVLCATRFDPLFGCDRHAAAPARFNRPTRRRTSQTPRAHFHPPWPFDFNHVKLVLIVLPPPPQSLTRPFLPPQGSRAGPDKEAGAGAGRAERRPQPGDAEYAVRLQQGPGSAEGQDLRPADPVSTSCFPEPGSAERSGDAVAFISLRKVLNVFFFFFLFFFSK